jgi:hypothetical protein
MIREYLAASMSQEFSNLVPASLGDFSGYSGSASASIAES